MRLRYGAAIAVVLMVVLAGALRTGEAEGRHRLRAIATAYCQKGITRGGNPVHRGVIAADPAVLPLGSVVRVEVAANRLSGIYTVDDTGGDVKGRRIDIFMPNCVRARRFGRKPAMIEVLERGEKRVTATE